MKEELTRGQRRVLAAIVQFQREHGFAPTLRELCCITGISRGSTNSMSEHLEHIERKGYIRREPLKSRAIVVTRVPADLEAEIAAATSPDVRRCRVCGCTEVDCSGCIERTGEPCTWVEQDLCSACTEVSP